MCHNRRLAAVPGSNPSNSTVPVLARMGADITGGRGAHRRLAGLPDGAPGERVSGFQSKSPVHDANDIPRSILDDGQNSVSGCLIAANHGSPCVQ
jgi:hypothetical protein